MPSFRHLAMVICFFLLQPEDAPGQCPTVPFIHSGEATYYYATGEGSCSFDATPSDLMVAAMNTFDYENSQVCGECVSLTGPDGIILVRIVDLCPGCQQGDIDLSREAFSLIADTVRGRVPITWKVVPCEVTGSIDYHFKDGSNQWWTAVQIRNHRHPIASLEYQAGGGTYKSVNRVSYNYFVESGGMGPGPYTFRVTDIYGHVLEDSAIPHIENGSVPGQAQFPACEDTLTSVDESGIPITFWLSQNYPNPWNPQTTIRYGLPQTEFVTIRVYDALGRQVAELVNERQEAGIYETVLGEDGLSGGVYYYRLRAGNYTATQKAILLK